MSDMLGWTCVHGEDATLCESGCWDPEPMHPWLWILWAIFNDIPCEHCGSEPFMSDGDHLEGCPTLNTCAQTDPHLAEPWHSDSSYTQGGPSWHEDWLDHLKVFHSHVDARTVTRQQLAQLLKGE